MSKSGRPQGSCGHRTGKARSRGRGRFHGLGHGVGRWFAKPQVPGALHTGCGSSSPQGPPEDPRRWGHRAWRCESLGRAPQCPLHHGPAPNPQGTHLNTAGVFPWPSPPAHPLRPHQPWGPPSHLWGARPTFPLPGPQATGCPASAPAPAETPVQGGLPCLPAPGPCLLPRSSRASELLQAYWHIGLCSPESKCPEAGTLPLAHCWVPGTLLCVWHIVGAQ